MNANEEEQRRERLRELQKMRGQTAAQPAADAAAAPSEGNNQRGAKLRELLQRRQGANAGEGRQAGGGRLLQALAGRGGGGGAGGGQVGGGAGGGAGGGGGLLRMALANRAGAGGAAGGQALGGDRKGAGAGNRGQLLRRLMEARQNRGGGAAAPTPSKDAQTLAELQNRVLQLTEEVERLRANQAAPVTSANPASVSAVTANAKGESPAAASAKKAEREVSKTGKNKS